MKARGFTLIELLVVISIISLLSSVVLSSLNSARGSSRDSKRIAEIKQIQNALEMYFFKYGTYPQVAAGGFTWARSSCATPGAANDEYYDAIQLLVDEGFLPVIPTDPLNEVSDKYYCYRYFTFGHALGNCSADSGSNIASQHEYALFFATENTTYNYPPGRHNNAMAGYCVLGPNISF